MQTNEAFEVLALQPGATRAEVKEAYRDLVKVWHPDRFGSDPRLRQKAEEKLRLLNDAYRLLQVSGGAVETESAGSRSGDAPSASYTAAPIAWNSRVMRKKHARSIGWILGLAGVVMGSVAGYLLFQRGWAQTAAPAPVERVIENGTANSGGPVQGEVSVEPRVRPAERAERGVTPKNAGGSSRSADYRVFSLSDAQTAQLESACSSQKDLHGAAAYQACVQVQLDSITKASSAPDLSALNAAERDSIESVCSGGKRGRGTDAYNRCLNAQMGAWAAEPSRPDLSTLSEADRNSIESACRNQKYREGPSAYDRCLVRFIKQLAEAR